MGDEDSAPGGSRLRDATCLTTTPSEAGRTPPPPCSVTSRLLDLSESAWIAVAGHRSFMMQVAAWRNSFSSANLSLRLLPQLRPLLTRTDVRLVQGGEPTTKGGGRRGLRGGETAVSPVLTHRLHPSRYLRHRTCRCHQSDLRHRPCHLSRHPRQGKESRRLAKPRAPAVVLRFCLKKG
jgi:hypothetical protein